MSFPATRLRRLRRTSSLRGLVRESHLSPQDLIQPLFVTTGSGLKEEIGAMPDIYRYSISELVDHAGSIQAAWPGQSARTKDRFSVAK